MSMKAMLLTGACCAAIFGAGTYAMGLDAVNEAKAAWAHWNEPVERVSYVYEMEAGDTVYNVAARVATPRDNINRLSWQICRDNGITDSGVVQPGTKLTIYVDPASEVLHGDR